MGNASRAEEFQKRSTCKRLFLGFLKLMKLEGTWDSVMSMEITEQMALWHLREVEMTLLSGISIICSLAMAVGHPSFVAFLLSWSCRAMMPPIHNNLVLQKGMWWPWSCSINCKKTEGICLPLIVSTASVWQKLCISKTKVIEFCIKIAAFRYSRCWLNLILLPLAGFCPVNSHLWQMGVTPWTYRLKLQSNPTITKHIHNTLYNWLWIQKLKKMIMEFPFMKWSR